MLDSEIGAALARTGDRETRLHLLDCRNQIGRALHPERNAVASTSAAD
jgi:hypothetical protein